MNKYRIFDWQNTEILITGGTGSLGKAITKKLIENYKPRGIRIYSRDEFKQWVMQNELKKKGYDKNIDFLIGDVRDKDRLSRAMNRVNLVFNAAAMKQVPACENNPIEAVNTNINGARNIIDTAIDNKVGIVMHISTDKAVYPINLYGATKTVAEKLFLHSNNYTGGHNTIFSVCRYGNVIGSRGSIVPLFLEQAKNGRITITDKRMSRFWITLDTVADFIIQAAMTTDGNEIFIPRMSSVMISDVISVLAPGIPIDEIGIRKGEKLHECLITSEESEYAKIYDNMWIINKNIKEEMCDRWSYTSDNNIFLKESEIRELIKPFIQEFIHV